VSEYPVEQVLVVPTELFNQLGYFQGFCDRPDQYVDRLLDRSNTRFLPRDEVETDPSLKQLIPYVLFTHTDDSGRLSIFTYTRGKGMGENRLHSKRSVGIGGHISSEDVGQTDNCDEAFEEGMRRELDEEVEIGTEYSVQPVGMINDDETEVGRVHLGMVYRFDCEHPKVKARETDIIESGFVPVEELLDELDQFETWSSITLKALFSK
jgi:predicted NUDIX family phosphoesterase